MVSYGNIYEFAFDSQNGADFLIVVSKKDYSGEVTRRPLGRAPVLKRENNGHIYGTSLEIYAECTIEGEYAQFYTSDPFEYRVQLYKNGSLLWLGYISPELYSEPDIAPPYDVQIIATDSLGELKNYTFVSNGPNTLLNHLNNILGISLSYQMISDLRYEKSSGALSNSSSEVMNIRIDLGHEEGENCYDVLQRLLESFNMSITQYNERWLLFRETDFINMASSDSVIAYYLSGEQVLLDIARFGSMNECEWWPVGQMSTVIEPARKKVTVQSPNHYKENALSASDWRMLNGASYDATTDAYILPDEGSNIVQKLDLDEEVGYRLVLNVSARNVGDGDEDQSLGVQVRIDGRGYRGEHQYWLIQQASSDRGVGAYVWKESEGAIEAELAVPSDSDTSADAQNIEIILPLYSVDPARFLYATSVEVTIFNPQGTHDIHVYGVQLSKYDQSEGYQSDVKIDNGAREEGDDITMSLTDGSTMPAAGRVFMTGVPIEYPDIVIKKWAVGADDPDILLTTISKDYARAVALPRMRYTGRINIPKGMTIPVLFIRNNTFYFPKTYSYDLWNDEVEVDLISVPAAEVSIASSVISEIKDTQGSSSSGSGGNSGGGSGSGIGGAPNYWKLDENDVLVTDKDVLVKGDVASGAPGQSTVVGVTKIILNGKEYPASNGIIDLGTIESGGGIEYITSQMVIDALKYTPAKESDLANYLPLAGGKTMTGTIRTSFKGSFLEDEGGNGIVGVNLSAGSWSGVDSGDAFGSVVSPTTLRSSGDNLYHYNTNRATAYKIVDAYNIGDMISGYAKKLTTGTYSYTTFDTTNKYVAFGDNAAKSGGYSTYIDGSSIYLRVNAGTSVAMSVASNANVTFEKNIVVKGDVASGGVSGSNNGYLPISGGTLNSSTDTPLTLNNTSGGGSWLGFQSNGATLGWFGYSAAKIPHIYDASGTARQILHPGNISSFALPLSGGTIKNGSIRNPLTIDTDGEGAYMNFSAKGTIYGYIGINTTRQIGLLEYSNGSTLNGIYVSPTSIGLGTSNPTLGKKVQIDSSTWDGFLALNRSISQAGAAISCYTNGAWLGNFGINGSKQFEIQGASGEFFWVDVNNGKTTIGRNAAQTTYMLDVNGQIRCTSVSQTSDIRYKDKIDDVILSLDTMADAPLFIFKWNNNPQDHATYLGTSAQYWEGHRKEVVSGDTSKGMDYATLGVAMGISNARITRCLEARIRDLEAEVERLRNAS